MRFLRRLIPSRCQTCGRWSMGDSCRACIEKLKMAMLEQFWRSLAGEVTAAVGRPARSLNDIVRELKDVQARVKARGDVN